jgi:hypothetical protein
MHYPKLIQQNKNVSTPATTADFLPTIMAILEVTSDSEWHPSGTIYPGLTLVFLLE